VGEAERVPVGPRLAGVGGLAGLLVALILWGVSLPRIDMSRIADYGLIPLLPLTFWAALAVLLVSFSVVVVRSSTATSLLLAHVVTLIAILSATPCLIYGTPRDTYAWKHVGLVDFLLRHNGVDASWVENTAGAYQFWPGFFSFNAMLVKACGLQTPLDYASWAVPFFNVLLIGPLWMIFRTFTDDRRLIWSATMIFFLGNWVGQIYFAPQTCAYFLYLTAIALCLRYLRRRSDIPARQRRLVVGLAIIPMILAIAPTHQLTPVVLVAALILLGVVCRHRVWLLLLLMIGLVLGWTFLFAGDWVFHNLKAFSDSFGTPGENATSGVTRLATATESQRVLAVIDRALSAAVWALALVGFVRRRSLVRGELALPVLAIAPFVLLAFNAYGGEMLFRAYMFGLPFAAFYAAAAFFPSRASAPTSELPVTKHQRGEPSLASRVALPAVLLLLVPGFVAGDYGREQANYYSPDEVNAARFLYGVAPRGSLIIGMDRASPWAFVNFELYDYLWFWPAYDEFPPPLHYIDDPDSLLDDPESSFLDMMGSHHHAYLLLSRSQVPDAEMTRGWPHGAFEPMVQTLTHSPWFTVIYRNRDAVIFTLTLPEPNKESPSEPEKGNPSEDTMAPAPAGTP
jgi:phosphate starvation-inducible membrane PsiE